MENVRWRDRKQVIQNYHWAIVFFQAKMADLSGEGEKTPHSITNSEYPAKWNGLSALIRWGIFCPPTKP